MPPESDPHLQAAFAELHRRRRAQAPSFAAMRARAQAAQPGRERRLTTWRSSLAMAGACLVAVALWFARPESKPPTESRVASAQRVEQLLTAIEQQLEIGAPLSAPDFPTDVLLSQNQTDPFP